VLATLRSHVRHNVVGYIALFVALGGTSAYASHLVVDSSDVVDNSLTGVDVRGKPGTSTTPAVNGSLTTDDIAGQQASAANGTPFVDGTLTQWDIKNNSVTGSDVLESSLAKVPDADKLDGLDSNAFARRRWAVVRDDGTLIRGQGVAAVFVGGGGYFVRFNADISQCAYTATVGQADTAYFDVGEIQATHTTGAGDPIHDVFVAISESETGAVQRGFSLVVTC
jgi:hypothetical protein